MIIKVAKSVLLLLGGLKFKTIWNLVGITIFIGLEKMNKPHVVMKHLQSSVFIF